MPVNYQLIRKYKAFGNKWYAVVFFPDLNERNEIQLNGEFDNIPILAEKLYNNIVNSKMEPIEVTLDRIKSMGENEIKETILTLINTIRIQNGKVALPLDKIF